MDGEVFTYIIDEEDIILSVSHNWEAFALANTWNSEIEPEAVVGHLLWDFIQGDETRHLYEELLRKCRIGEPIRPIPFRCDSPQERRYLELMFSPLSDGQIKFVSKILKTERRDPVSLLENGMPRSGDLIRICSMCKKNFISNDEWVEIEEGLVYLRLFEAGEMPRLTHGLCPECYEAAISVTV